MKVPWNFFAKRRGYDLRRMLAEGMFKTYNDYVKWCDNKDVAPLVESEFKTHLPPKQKPKPKPKPRARRKAVKKETIAVSTKETKQEKENE